MGEHAKPRHPEPEAEAGPPRRTLLAPRTVPPPQAPASPAAAAAARPAGNETFHDSGRDERAECKHGGDSDQRLWRKVFEDAVNAYNQALTMAFAEYRTASEAAWRAYQHAMTAASAGYDRAVGVAGRDYDKALAVTPAAVADLPGGVAEYPCCPHCEHQPGAPTDRHAKPCPEGCNDGGGQAAGPAAAPAVPGA